MFSFFRNSKNIIDRLKSPQLNNKLNFELSEVYLGYGVEKKEVAITEKLWRTIMSH